MQALFLQNICLLLAGIKNYPYLCSVKQKNTNFSIKQEQSSWLELPSMRKVIRMK